MPDSLQPLRTISKTTESILKDKGSIFHGFTYPVKEEPEITGFLHELKKKYYDATHYCYAYRIRNDRFKYSDDGEPNGTAGVRILNAINHFKLEEILCVVVRWFGGKKLGAGPLGKAYYTVAKNTLECAEIIEKFPFYECRFNVPYEYTSLFYHILDKYSVKMSGRSYTAIPQVTCFLPVGDEQSILDELIQSSQNNIKFSKKEEAVYF